MHAGQRLEDGVAQALRALHPQDSGVGRLESVELVEAERVREARGHAAVVHGGLGALGLQLVEDLRQLLDLRLVEVQPVGEEPQRAPDAESAAAADIVPVAPVEAEAFAGRSVAGMRPATPVTASIPQPMQHSWVHGLPLSPRQCAPGGYCSRVGTMPHAPLQPNAAGPGVNVEVRQARTAAHLVATSRTERPAEISMGANRCDTDFAGGCAPS